MVGKTISHYEISDKLGEGGMGVVYKAKDTKLGRPVALKFLSKELSGTEKARERFLREARATSAVDHPSISTTYGIEEVDGQTFIVMAYVEGESLSEKIFSGSIDVDEAVNIAIQVADGLREAHDKGIVHRDIKSANIMITKNGLAKIMDFGLAKLAGHKTLTKTTSVMGTVGYMSPEQARGKHVDHRTDIWSLGVVLYEMLAGVPPFRSDNEQAVIYCIVNEEPEPIAKVRSDIPPALAYIVEKMLQKDRRNRYPDFASVIADLKSVAGAPDRIPDGFPRLKTTKLITPKRTRIAASAAIVAVALGIGLAGFLLLRGSRHEQIQPRPPGGEGSAPSIAVLPFEDLSPAKDQEYFCDGLSDELINALAHYDGLRVVARTSCFAFKNEKVDVRDIGEKLNVTTVLEGSVRKAGNSLRVNAQLVNVADGYQIWVGKYERDLKDVFNLQDEISRAIADNLKVTLLSGRTTQIARRHTENLEAYNLYLKGRWFWYKFTDEGFTKAIEYFEKAIEVDPNYALAYAGLADAYGLMPGFTPMDPNDTFPRAKEAALKALELDDTLAEAHCALAWIKMQYDWDFEKAEEEFLVALDLNPGLAHVYSEYGLFLMYMDRDDEAIEMNKKALEIDPVSLIVNTNMIWIYEKAQKYPEAIEAAHKTFELDQRFPWSHHALGSVYFNMGRVEEAKEEYQKEVDRSDQWNQVMETQIGASYGVLQQTDLAQRSLETMLEKSKHQYVSPYLTAHLFLYVGDVDKFYEYLNMAYDERDYFLLNLKIQLGTLEPLCHDPRMIALMEKMGFDKASAPATAEAAAPPDEV